VALLTGQQQNSSASDFTVAAMSMPFPPWRSALSSAIVAAFHPITEAGTAMSIDFACPGCHHPLRSDDQHAGLATRCPSCGTTSTIPVLAEMIDEGIQTSAASASETRVAVEPFRRSGHCPGCGKPLSEDAVLCVECGYDRRLGRRHGTRVKRLHESWRTGMPLIARITAAVFSVPLMMLIAYLVVEGLDLPRPLMLVGLVPGVLLAILCAGSFSTLRVSRSKKGRIELLRRSYLGFMPLSEVAVNPKRCEAIVIDTSPSLRTFLGMAEWDVWVILFNFGVVGLMLWTANTEGNRRFTLRLEGKRRRDTLLLYCGTDDELMGEIVSVLQETTGLPLKREGL
jgi:hypothetical protein